MKRKNNCLNPKEPHRFTIPGGLTDLNDYINKERSHRMQAAKLKKSQTDMVALCAMNLPIFDTIFLEIDYYLPNKRKDKDNIAFAKKFILDGLVEAGKIKGDGWKHIIEHPVLGTSWIERFKIDKDNPRIEVKVFPGCYWDFMHEENLLGESD